MDSEAKCVILAKRALLDYEHASSLHARANDPMFGLRGPVALHISESSGLLIDVVALSHEPLAAQAQQFRSTGKYSSVEVADVVLPGFVDIHTHGRGGAADMADFWLNPEYTLERLPQMGTTSVLASMVFCCGQVTGTESKAQQTYKLLSTYIGSSGTNRAVLEGIHAEGPVVADLGGLPPSECQRLPVDAFESLVQLMEPCGLRMMTIAPSIDAIDDYARIKILLKNNVLVALGHDRNCTEDDILGALRTAHAHGKRCHITHIFNVSSFHHRDPSLCNFGMIGKFPALGKYRDVEPPTVEFISDLAHVHPLTLEGLLTSKPLTDLACITDSVMEPLPGVEQEYNGRTMVVSDDGRAVTLKGTCTIAGSCSSLLDSFRTLVRVFRLTVAQACHVVATNPARFVGLHTQGVGKIQPGTRADLLLFTEADPSTGTPEIFQRAADMTLTATYVAGKPCRAAHN
eukprot:m.718308 g.718308  ORF g.718308 m.718308 type:complete len:460 (+) comp22994_c1_seq2:98-1477(+)